MPKSKTKNTEIPVEPISSKSRFSLLNQDGAIVATLIDRDLAEQWVSEHRKGAVKYTVKSSGNKQG